MKNCLKFDQMLTKMMNLSTLRVAKIDRCNFTLRYNSKIHLVIKTNEIDIKFHI